MPGMDTETQDAERQCRGASIRIRCPATTNEKEPAWADELSTINARKKQKRFMQASPENIRAKLDARASSECDLSHPQIFGGASAVS